VSRRMSKIDRGFMHANKAIEQGQMNRDGKASFVMGWLIGYEVALREARRKNTQRLRNDGAEK
jgi:hypothetical protein